jgi:hypothetical protein
MARAVTDGERSREMNLQRTGNAKNTARMSARENSRELNIGKYRSGSQVPFAKASSVSARSRQTGERSGYNRDTIQGTNKRAKVAAAKKASPKTVGY